MRHILRISKIIGLKAWFLFADWFARAQEYRTVQKATQVR